MISNKVKEETAKNSEPELTVEDIFEKLGGYSWFQFLATLALISAEIPGSMLALSPVLIGASSRSNNVDNLCCSKNSTNCTARNFSENGKEDFFQFSTINEEFGLFCERGWIIDTLTSVQMIGCTIGSLLCPILADKLGRKKVFYALSFAMGFFGIASGCTTDVISYGFTRFFLGVAIGGMYVHYLLYLMEFLTPSFRTICGCVSFWAVGEMLLALFAYLIPQWRILSWVISLPALILLLSISWIPESPRFLLCHERTAEAIEAFNLIASINKREPVDNLEIQKLQSSIKAKLKEEESYKVSNGRGILKSQQHSKQFLIFILAWFTCSITYYGLSFNTKNLAGDLFLNVFYLGVSDLPGNFSAIFFNNRFGRKKAMQIFLLLGTSSFISLSIIQEIHLSNLYPNLVIILSLFGRYCISASWAVIACFTSESFPTTMRATSVGLCAFSGNIGGILSPYMPFLAAVSTSGPYILMSVLSLLTIIISIGLNEVVRKPLEDAVTHAHN